MRTLLVRSVATGLGGQMAVLVSGIIAARLLGPQDRGNLALLVLIPLALSQLGNLGLPLALTYQLSRNEATGRGALRNLARPAVGMTALLVLVHAAIIIAITRDQDVAVQVAAAVTLLVIPADSAQVYGLAILQGRRDFTAFNVLRLLPALLYSALAIGAFVVGRGSLVLFALLFTLSYAFVAAAALITALHRSPPERVADAPGAISLFRFGIRGLIGSVSPLETLRVDQVIVGLLISPAALGLYVVAVAFTNLPRFVAQSIGLVAYPYVAAEHDPSRARRSTWRFVIISIAVSFAIIVPLEILAPWIIPTFFGEAYAPAVSIMQILLVSSLFLSIRRVLTDTSRGMGQPGLGTVAEIVAWISLVPGVVILVPPLGVEGVAVAVTISSAVSLAVLIVLVGLRRASATTVFTLAPEESTIEAV